MWDQGLTVDCSMDFVNLSNLSQNSKMKIISNIHPKSGENNIKNKFQTFIDRPREKEGILRTKRTEGQITLCHIFQGDFLDLRTKSQKYQKESQKSQKSQKGSKIPEILENHEKILNKISKITNFTNFNSNLIF